MKPNLSFGSVFLRVADLGEESSVPALFGERILQNHLVFHLDEEDEIYAGYGRRKNAYPYCARNMYTRELSEREVKRAVLENDYLKAVFLTEYGGRLWELWDKKSGRNLLYTNDVLRFSNLAVRNAWFSGGVEWNVGVIGHTPLTTEPLYVAETATDRGDPVLRMYEYERIRGAVYQMDFWLEESSPFLNCRMRITNESSEVLPMYWWSNIAVEEYDGGKVIVPAKEAFTFENGGVSKVAIPYVKGVDVTEYQNIEKSVDYFFHLEKDAPRYIANVDKEGYGLLQLSTDRLQSRKLFCWGKNASSNHWQEFLTDKAGRYVEIQAGLAKTQYGCLPMAPYTAWEWMEQYGSVKIPAQLLSQEHSQRAEYLTGQICADNRAGILEQKLLETKAMARKRAPVVWRGSGYGAFAERGKLTEHLEFSVKEAALQKWQAFFETGLLPCPNPMERPEVFPIQDRNVAFLKEHMQGENSENWYAYYHLGLGLYDAGRYKKAAKAFAGSLELAKNPWALHGLSCAYLMLGRDDRAAEVIIEGMAMRSRDASYLKEGFKFLYLCQAYQELCSFYENLRKEEQQISRVRFYYISALHKLGRDLRAYELLEENGGMELEDIREGEDSLAQLWSELHKSIYKTPGQVPYKYNFKAY